MQKKVLISLGLITLLGLTIAQASAKSTIYTDELGRMHFLGKDPETKTLQRLDDYGNPDTKEITNTTYGLRNIDKYDAERYNVRETGISNSISVTDNANKTKKTKTTTYTTNVKPKDPLSLDDGNVGKRFWQLW